MRMRILLHQLGRDVRDGVRQVRRKPAFSAVAVATLALGIGANTAMFSAVDAVLIRPLPYTDADRLVMVWDDVRQTDSKHFFTTPAEWSEWRRQNTVFTEIAASQPGDAALSGEGEPEEIPARKVSANFWSVLDVKPLLGRVFTEDEDVTGARVVVISHGLWQRRFGGSPDVVGRTITLNDPRTIDRLRLQGSLATDEAASRLRAISDWLEAIDLVLLRPPVLRRANEPLPTPLGTLDALHLATALIWRDRMGSLSIVATHDGALGLAARTFGFEVRGI